MANVGDGLVRGQLIKVELDAMVVAVVPAQWITKNAIHPHGRSRHTHDATFQGTQAGHAAFCGAHCAQNLLRVGIEISSPLAGRDAARRALEQWVADLALKLRTQLADSRLRGERRACRGREAAQFVQSAEDAKLLESDVHARSSSLADSLLLLHPVRGLRWRQAADGAGCAGEANR